ncbi:MAG: DUF4892 domain-containing protein [Pseudomonadota bacterium]
MSLARFLPSVSALLAAAVLLPTLLPMRAVAAEDLPGSRNPLDIPRFPHSWIVRYEQDDRFLPREYALGRVDKTRRDVRIEHEVRASATREYATYEMPGGTQTRAVIEHYLKQIGSEPLFTCRGRDCGRSNLWANEVFKQNILLGPDLNQFYFAGEYGDHLIALYVIQRGNKRSYAHVEVLKPENRVALSHNEEIFERLAGEGLAMVDGITPGAEGALNAADRALLAGLGESLSVFAGQTVYVVCHLYGPAEGAVLLSQSTACAEEAVSALAATDSVTLVPFGAGPLLPRVGGRSRLEFVLPSRLSRGIP